MWRGSVERGTGQQMKTCLTPCPPDSLGCPAAENAKCENDAISSLNQEESFLPLLPPALHFGIQFDTKHQAGFLNVMQHVKIPSPGALNGWQLLLLLKGMLSSPGLN